SSHDLIENDPRLSKELAVKEFETLSSAEDHKKSKPIEKPQEITNDDEDHSEDDSVAFDRKMKDNVRKLQESAYKRNNQEEKLSKTDIIRKEIEQVKKDIKKLDRSKNSDDEGEPAKKKIKVSYVEDQRKKYLSSGKALTARRKKGNEAETLEKLKSFQSKLMVAEPTEDTPISIDEDAELCILHSVPNCLSCRDTFGQPDKEDTDEGWLSHRLIFEKDHKGKDLMQRRDDPNDYVVIDPLERKKQAIEQEKEKRAQKGKISE
ncbi:12606_t:CDS:2, partial [Acaulospora morrowiae]